MHEYLVARFLVVGLLVGRSGSVKPTSECNCGYGGVCMRDLDDGSEVANVPCKVCDEVSSGFYDDCSEIVDHCEGRPCENGGTCRSTWGSYYCDCLPNYFGQKCDIFEPSFTGTHLPNKVFIYHQIQPDSYGLSSMEIMYDPGHNHHQGDVQIHPKVTISDNRVYRPLRHTEFVRKNVHKRCVEEAKANENLYDSRICKLIPRGDIWTFTLDTTLYNIRPEYEVLSEAKMGVIGIIATVRFEVDVFTKLGNNFTIFNATYKIFTYRQQRLPNNCDVKITFQGCSQNILIPRKHSRGHPLKIQAIRSVKSCSGTLVLGYQWYMQRNVLFDDKYEHDGFPKLIIDDQNASYFIQLPEYYFDAGVHMIVFSYSLRGEPPHYGSQRVFHISGFCWVRIVQNTPWFEIKGGSTRSVSCFRPLHLTIRLVEPSFQLSEFTFSTKCDEPSGSDPECAPRTLPGNILKKVKTPCLEEFQFTITASHKKNHVADVEINAKITFYFMESTIDVECLSNCYLEPIDPFDRVVVYAHTEPHVEGEVEWEVYKNLQRIQERDGNFDSVFCDSKASRAIRINGFIDTQGPAPYVWFKISKKSKQFNPEVVMSTKIDNLGYFQKYFSLVKGSKEGFYTYNKSNDPVDFEWLPVRFRIYNLFEKLGAFVIKADTTYESRLTFKSSSSTSVLCLQDSIFTEHCHEWQQVDFVRKELTLDDCERALRTGDIILFMESAVIYLTNNLYYPGDSIMEWKNAVEDNHRLINMLDEVDTYNQHALMELINVLDMIFYSEVGCRDLGLNVSFVNRVLDNYQALGSYLEMKAKAKSVLGQRIDFFDMYSKVPGYKLLRTPLGDPLQCMIRAWTLIYLGDLHFKPEDPTDFPTLYIIGEITHWFVRSIHSTLLLVLKISPSMGRLSNLFEGIRTIGSKAARTWMTRCTYKCILNYLDKSTPSTETLEGYTDHFFGRIETNETGNDWFLEVSLDFPETSAAGWEHKIFSMVVWAAKSRPQDTSWTPAVYVELRDDDNDELIRYFPKGLTYNISLPPMVAGELIDLQKYFFGEYTIEQPRDPSQRPRHFLAFKITFPIKVWNFTVFFIRAHQVKGIVAYDDIPDYNEVNQSPQWEGRPAKIGNLSGYSYNTVLQHKDESNVIYFGMTLSESEPPGIYRFFVRSKYAVCIAQDIFKGGRRCEELQGDYEGLRTSIKCRCDQIGFVFGAPFPVNNMRLLMDDILLTFPQRRLFHGIIIGAVMLLSTAALPVIAWFLERRREAKASFVFLDYEYPADTYRMVIGVHTGMNMFAGTWSDVAIQLIGRSGSSRVIVLRTRTKKVLEWASDYWFLVNTSASLGPLTRIVIFHDFRYLSDWFCSHIMIHDCQTSQWYYVAVQRWFKLYPSDDDSQMVMLPIAEFKELDEDLLEMEYSFNSYYFKELRNTHLPFSMFLLHYRSVATYEQKFLLYLVKLMTVILISWGFQDFGLEWVMHQLDLTADNLTTLSWDTISIVTAIALTTRIFTFPLSILYRWMLRSGLLMSKTTSRRSRSRSHTLQPVSDAERKESNTSHATIKFTTDSDKTRATRFSTKSILVHKGTGQSVSDQRKSGLSDARSDHKKSELGDGRKHTELYDPHSQSRKTDTSFRFPTFHSRVQRKSSNSSSHHGSSSNLIRRKGRGSFLGQQRSCATIVLGPTLFRSVNISPSVFKVRSRMNTWQARCSVSFLVLLLLVYFFYEEGLRERTHYWNRAHVFFFFLFVTLFIDTVLLEPFFIFTKSLLAYVVFEMSNNDLNLWNPATTVDVAIPRNVTWKIYLEKATQKECKPILSSTLNNKRKRQQQIRILQLSLLYICMIGVAYNCYEQLLVGSYADIMRIYKEAMASSNEEPATKFVHGSIGTKDVHSSKELMKYLVTNFVIQTFTWVNGKPISLKKKFWDKTRYSIPLGATKLIVLLMSPSEGKSVQMDFDKYFDDSQSFFTHLAQETEPVYLNQYEYTYESVNNRSSIRGSSGENYPMKGHTSHFSFRSWPHYYSALRHDVESFVDGKHIIPRAFIFSTNYFNPNMPGLSTVDLIVEFLPSGLRTAKIYVHVTRMYGSHTGLLYSSSGTSYPSIRFRIVSGILLIVLLLFNVYVVLKIGIKTYFTDFHWIIRALFLLSCFLNAMSSAFILDFKYERAHEILHDFENEFLDVHDVYDLSDLYDKLFLGLVFFFLGMEAMCLTHSLMSSERLDRVFTKCMAVMFSLTILEIGLATVHRLIHNNYDQRTLPLAPYISLKQMYPVNLDNHEYHDGFLSVTVILVVYLSRFGTGFVIQMYNAGPDRGRTVWRGIKNDFAGHLHNEGICKHHAVLTWFKSKTNLPAENRELRLQETKSPAAPTTASQPQQKRIGILEEKFSVLGGRGKPLANKRDTSEELIHQSRTNLKAGEKSTK